MKTKLKTLLLLLAVTSLTLTSCKKKTESDQNSGKDRIHPPSWIQFTWTKPSGFGGVEGYEFTNNDMYVVMYDADGTRSLYMSQMMGISMYDYSITEQSTNASYQFTIHYNNRPIAPVENFQFDLLPNGQLKYTDTDGDVDTYTKRN